MKIGVAQLNSSDSVQQNLKSICDLIKSSESEKPDILFFPENSLYFRIDPAEKVKPISLDDAVINEIAKLCVKLKVAVHLTTPVLEKGQVFNATILIRSDGVAEIVYRKIHLFDIELAGQKAIRESESFDSGDGPSISDFNSLRIGNSICYDIRFAELYSTYAKAQVDLIVVPAAFLVKTGQAHWEVLLRARAIESQCYVVAAAQTGTHKSVHGELFRETFGHSMIVDPWGQIVAVKPKGTGLIYSEVDQAEVAKVRRQIPMHSHRRNVF